MFNQPPLSRRHALQAGLVTLGTIALSSGTLAHAASSPLVEVQDLGPGVQTFTMFATTAVGDTIYMSSRNVEPMQVVGFHMPTGTITSITDVYGESTQALAATPDGRYLYGCVRINFGDNVAPVSRLFRIDLEAQGGPALESLEEIQGLIPFAMTVSPDGVVFFTGRAPDPKVYEYRPDERRVSVLATPDVTAQYGRSIAANETTVFYGLRGVHPTTGATVAGLYAVDRATGVAQSILPPEAARWAEPRDLLLHEGSLVFANGNLAVLMDPANPASYSVVRAPQSLGRLWSGGPGVLYFGGNKGILSMDRANGTFRVISPNADIDTFWGIWPGGDRIGIVSAYGFIAEVDPLTDETAIHDLVELGAPLGTQLAMSVATGGGVVYVGGTNAISRRNLAEGTTQRLFAPGEAKDMIVLEEKIFTGQYSGWGVMTFDPGTDERFLRQLAVLPNQQNRPHDVLWDAERQRIYIGSGSDADVQGALTVFNPVSGLVEAQFLNPFGDRQQVRSIAQSGNTLFLGGEGATGGHVMAWDLETQQESWRISLNPAPKAVSGLAVLDDRLIALGHSGGIHLIDIPGKRLIESVVRPDLLPDWGTLTVRGGKAYGVSASTFFRLNKHGIQPEVLVKDLSADWYGNPRVAVDGNRFYGIRGRNLIRMTVHG